VLCWRRPWPGHNTVVWCGDPGRQSIVWSVAAALVSSSTTAAAAAAVSLEPGRWAALASCAAQHHISTTLPAAATCPASGRLASMATSLQDSFLAACKSGDIETVRLALHHGVNVNSGSGWALRRAVRYNHPQVWQCLLDHKELNVNLPNQFGLSALHTACRFNVAAAIFDLLRQPGILCNERTVLGSSPLMVSVKYASREAVDVIIRDRRIDMGVVDLQGRGLEQVVGVAVKGARQEDTRDILDCLASHRQWRREEEGRRDSLEEENIDIDGLHRLKVFDKIKELVGELHELHKTELTKLQDSQELESQQFIDKLERDLVAFLERQQDEQTAYLGKIQQEKVEFDRRQAGELERLEKKQQEETGSLQQPGSRQSDNNSPKSALCTSRPSSRRPSLKTHIELPSCETLSDSSGPSVWEWTVPDEGYCTGKAGPTTPTPNTITPSPQVHPTSSPRSPHILSHFP